MRCQATFDIPRHADIEFVVCASQDVYVVNPITGPAHTSSAKCEEVSVLWTERFWFENIGVFAKFPPAKVKGVRGSLEFGVWSSKFEFEEEMLGVGRGLGGEAKLEPLGAGRGEAGALGGGARRSWSQV